MILNIQQHGLIAVLFALLISCNPGGDLRDREPVNKNFVTTEATPNKNTRHNDVEFAELIAENGLLEVQLAALVINKSSSDTIKTFAVSVMTDFTVFNSELQEIAETKNVTLPCTLSQKSQKKYDELANKPAHKFDKAYCAFLVRNRQEAVVRFKEEAETGKDPMLRDWAARKIVFLEQHLAAAKRIKSL